MIETVFLNELENGGSGQANVESWARRLHTIGEAVAITPTGADKTNIVGPGQETTTLDEDQSVGRMARHLGSDAFWYLNLSDGFTDMRGRAQREGHEGFRTSLETNAHIPRSLKEERVEIVLNAMYNIGLAVRDPQQRAALDRLISIAQSNSSESTHALEQYSAFVVMSHNNPRETSQALDKWYQAGANLRIPLYTFLNDHNSVIYQYGQRFYMNYPAMAGRIHELRIRYENVRVPTESERFERILEEIRSGRRQ